MKKIPWKLAFLWAAIAFPLSFLIFNVAYVYWAVKAYPHNNSMAGFAAFIYGFPVGLASSFATFAIVLVVASRKRKQSVED